MESVRPPWSKVIALLMVLVMIGSFIGLIPIQRTVSAQTPSCGDTITTDTTLSANIGPCSGYGLVIAANSLTLNCNGFTITGSGTYVGIYLDGVEAVTVENCSVSGFEVDFVLINSPSSTFISNVATDSVYSNPAPPGGYVFCDGDGSSGVGLLICDSSGSSVQNNVANDNNVGFDIQSSGVAVTNNIAEGTTALGFYVYYASGDTLSDNTANSAIVGFELAGSTDCTLTGNTAYSNSGFGFASYKSSSNTFTGNTASNNGEDGFALYTSSDNNVLLGNTANGNAWDGFGLSAANLQDFGTYSSANTLSGNTANSNAEYGYDDGTSGSGTAGTANSYTSDTCLDNGFGGSSPTGLCGTIGITSVSAITTDTSSEIVIQGFGFGSAPAQVVPDQFQDGAMDTGGSPSISIWDNCFNEGCGFGNSWQAGDCTWPVPACTGGENAIGIFLSSWSNTEIVIDGFGPQLSTGVCSVSAPCPPGGTGGTCSGSATWTICTGDSMTVEIWGPSGAAATFSLTAGGASPTLTTSVSPSSEILTNPAEPAVDIATLSGGSSPTGSISFQVYYSTSPTPTCTDLVFTSASVSVSGNGIYPESDSYTPSAVGYYYWTAFYSGDLNNEAFTTPCGAAGETLTVTPPTTTTSTSASTTTTTSTTSTSTTSTTITTSTISTSTRSMSLSTTTLTCGSPVDIGTESLCTVTVSGALGSITNELVFFSASGPGTFDSTYCDLGSAGSCNVHYTPTSAVPAAQTITASYGGDANDLPSSGTFTLSVSPAQVGTTITCGASALLIDSSTTCTATVTGGNPTGTVSWSQSGTGSVSFSPASAECTLSSSGGVTSCPVTVTGEGVGPVTLKADYLGDENDLPSSGTLAIAIGSVAVSCSPAPVVGKSTTCTATLIGSEPFTGTVTWSSSGPGRFSSTLAICKLSKTKDSCSVKYIPSAAGTVAITASYGGNTKNPASSGTFSLTVSQAISKTIVSCSQTSVIAGSTKTIKCTAKVIGYSPSGTVTWAQSGMGSVTLSSTNCTLAKGSCSITLAGTTTGNVTIQATYNGDANNLPSSATRNINVR